MTTLLFLLLLAGLQSSPQSYQSEPAESADNAWTILNNGLSDKAFEKRTKATHALGLLNGSEKAEQLALNALQKDTTGEVRAEGATALGQMDAKSTREQLIQALNDKDVRVVVAAANSLYLFKDPAAYEVYYAILTGERKSGNSLIRQNIDMLRDRKQLEMLMFNTGIGFIPFAGGAWGAYRTITHHDTSPVRALAAERLGNDPDPKTTAALGRACSDSNWRVRMAVVEAIAKRGNPALLYSVGPLLYDSNDDVRFDAAACIIRLSSKVSAAAAHVKRSQ